MLIRITSLLCYGQPGAGFLKIIPTMIFVAVEELIPESQANGNVDIATSGAIVGFAIMMTLDVALG